MDKGRLEAFSDNVFSIAMTLLIFNITVPSLAAPVSDAALWATIDDLLPSIIVFFLTFAVLSVMWINHHFIFHRFAKSVDRRLNLINLAYLAFVAFVPFSASFIARYHSHQAAAILYGIDIFMIVLLAASMIGYLKRHPEEMLSDSVTQRLMNQATFRSNLSLFSYLIGLAASFVSVPLALFFYAFPTIFNIIPGSLDLAERVFGFTLD